MDAAPPLGHSVAMRWKLSFCLLLGSACGLSFVAAEDVAGQEAAGIVAGVREDSGARLDYNKKAFRLEVRDDLGNLLEEIPILP